MSKHDKPLFLWLIMNIKINAIKLISDKTTPVRAFTILRDKFPEGLLLESSDYKDAENSRSFLCFDCMSSIRVKQGKAMIHKFDGLFESHPIAEGLEAFFQSVSVDKSSPYASMVGFFGFTAYDAIQYFEDVRLSKDKRSMDLDEMRYGFYRFQIIINHFNEELLVIENQPEGQASRMKEILEMVESPNATSYSFKLEDEFISNTSDEAFMEMVTKGKEHCQRGDVFQVVLARRFAQKYKGDEFNVYRSLRSINPSPYLFYFNFGDYSLFGSSPEAQIIVKDHKAQIHPIAGTYRRTGDDEKDRKKAQELFKDEKENAEHIMLVDLARNDLGRNGKNIELKKLKEIQFFSHVIHLTSVVEASLDSMDNSRQIFQDTFPAGTLSGAPKVRAMQIIDELEKENRSFYGGALGFFGLDGSINHAIIIRSFLAKNNYLYFQAGAGVVIKSDEQKELEEINNKLAALRAAIKKAELI